MRYGKEVGLRAWSYNHVHGVITIDMPLYFETIHVLVYTLQVAQVWAKLRERVVQENLIETCASVTESSFIVKYCFS